MSAGQRLAFKKAVVAQAVRAMTARLPPPEHDDGHRKGVDAAERWLGEPTPEVARDVSAFASGECWDGGVRYHDYPADFLDPAWAAGADDPCEAARLAANATPAATRGAVRAWQVGVAGAVLRGEAWAEGP